MLFWQDSPKGSAVDQRFFEDSIVESYGVSMRVALCLLCTLFFLPCCLAAVTACLAPPTAGSTPAQEASLGAIFNKVVVQSVGCTAAGGPLCEITKTDLAKLRDRALDASINYSACSAKSTGSDANKRWYRNRAPRASMTRKAANSSGGVRSAIGLLPIRGKMSFSKSRSNRWL